MLEITLQRAGRRLLKEPIGTAPITVGRARENTIRLLDPDVSRRHCRIEWQGDALHAVDLSTNGMLVNSERARDARVDVGDRITIGPWNLLIETTVDAVPVKTLVSEPHATRVIAFDPAKKRLRTQRVEVIVRTPDQAPLKKRVAKGEILIGHHASCDVAVADGFVSRRHCKLIVDGEKVKLVDMASTNGVWIGKARVTQVAMEPQGSFSIGRSTVNYRVVSGTENLAPSKRDRLGELIGASRTMRELFALIERAAPSDAAVVITGESGTGKELAARELHRLSRRKNGPFVAINCGALPANLIESQLFGHERGAFTGALERMPGLLEQANKGTLFLDEIGEMPLELQTKLLRVLEERRVRRVGAQVEIEVDFRLVTATNRDLPRMVKEGKFREDLLYRIYVVPIEMPPLRDRAVDIPLLAKHFISELATKGRRPSFTEAALEALARCPWMGNVRELRNSIERTLLFAERDVIDAPDLSTAALGIRRDAKNGLKDQERTYIADVIAECDGNISQSARKLGIARSSLQGKINRLKIELPKP